MTAARKKQRRERVAAAAPRSGWDWRLPSFLAAVFLVLPGVTAGGAANQASDVVVKAALEEVSTVVVAPVEPFRIHAVQPVHTTRDVCLRRLDQQVIVIGHQAIRMAHPSEEVDHLLNQPNEPEPVAGVDEDPPFPRVVP